jgi:hypothetical protein
MVAWANGVIILLALITPQHGRNYDAAQNSKVSTWVRTFLPVVVPINATACCAPCNSRQGAKRFSLSFLLIAALVKRNDDSRKNRTALRD